MRSAPLLASRLFSGLVSGLFWGLLLAGPALAQERAEVSVDPSVVGLEDFVELTVSVPEVRDGRPELPPLPAFEAFGSQMTTSTSFVNGRMTRSVSWTYRLHPREVGEFTIPPIPVPGYEPTPPISVTVEPGSRRSPSPGPGRSPFGSPFDPLFERFRDPFGADPPPRIGERDLFIQAEVSDREVLVGEQVLVLYRLYARVPVAVVVPVEPAQPQGFWVEEVPLPDLPWREQGLSRARIRELRESPGPRREQRVVDGVTYDTYPILLRAAFPTGAGEREFPGPTFEIGVPGRSRSVFLAPTAVETRAAPAVTIRTNPLPDPGAGSTFSGTVGDYRLRASLVRDGAPLGDEATPAGEPLVLRLELEGDGNLQAAGTPRLDGDPGFERAFRFFDPESSQETGLREAGAGTGLDAFRFGGRRVWEFPVVPEAGGVHQVASARLDVFNPETSTYETLTTDPFPVRVEGGIAAIPAPAGGGTVERLGDDIRYLQPLRPAPASPPAPFSAGWWIALALGLPVAWNLAVFAALRRRAYRAAHADHFRREGAAREALRRLQRIRDEGEGAAAAIGVVLADYAAARLGVSPHGLTPEGARERFVAAGADPDAARDFAALLSRTQAARFAAAPASGRALPTGKEAAELVRRLDSGIRRSAA